MSIRTFAALALLSLCPVLGHAQSAPEREETDEGCPDQRIHEYLERHGDFGRIDPNVMLKLTRQTKQALDSRRFSPLSIGGSTWQSIGPTNGAGRATALALHPTAAGTVIVGAAGGGAWKSTDGGATWKALTDDIPNLSVGSLAYAPSDPNTVYLGTGEGGYAGDFIPGIGLLMSNDGGESWQLPAAVAATEFYRILVNATDAQDLLAATNAGLLRSKTGQNGPWKTVINSTSMGVAGYGDVTDLVRDPTDVKTLYATTWDRRLWCVRSTTTCAPDFRFETPSVMKSTDSGATWTPSSAGLPTSTKSVRVNRMSIAIAPSAPQMLYVATSIFDSDSGREISHIYKSTDGAATWVETNLGNLSQNSLNTYLSTQAWYGNTLVVSPADPNTVVAGGVIYVRTTDGGATWTRVLNNAHVDVHDLRYDSQNVLWIANDGGVWSSADLTMAALDHNKGLVTRQFYDIANDPVNHNRVYGGQQDNGTIYRSDAGGTSWSSFSGGDGFACAVVPTAPSIAFGTVQNGVVLRTVTAGSLYRVVERTPPYEKDELTPFYSSIEIDPQTPSTIYTASYRVWKSTTEGDGWVPLPTRLTGDATWPTDAYIRVIAIAKKDPRVIMVATASPRRKIYRTTNGGLLWTDVTSNLPPGRTILKIDIDPRDTQHAFAALAGTSGPSVYVTSDGGTTWQARATGLPSFSAQTVRFDPTDPNTIYAGTDVGVYRSIDSGATWDRFGTGMPAVSVYDVDPTADGSILRAATHGRGVWELKITDQTNQPPGVVISTPAGHNVVVMKGASVSFNGFTNDFDDTIIAAAWNFPDSWSSVPAQNGVAVTHRFDRTGRFPVGLSAVDPSGGIGEATVEVDVVDPADTCATPSDIPSAGPFPYSVTFDTDLATKEPTDPRPSTTSCYPFVTQTSTWLTFTPQTAGDYQFSLCGSDVSAVLVGYTSEGCDTFTNSAMCISRPSTTSDCASTSSTQTLTLAAGQTIRMFVTNYFADDFGNVTITVSQNSMLSPIVSSVAPAVGVPGTSIIISGLGFTNGATVSVGGVPAQNVTFVSGTTLTATIAPNIAGNANVAVSNPDGTTGTLKEGFTYEFVPAGPKRRAVRR
ncbi:MAG TPA: IPT/TIG domain-containing protein [Thermoanaerobaculia bacterium]